MNSIVSSNIGRRILLLVTVSILLMLTGLAISGWLATRWSKEQVFHESQSLAEATASYLDYILGQNLARLDSIQLASGVDISDNNLEPEKRALHSIYLSSILDGVFITDEQGTVLWAEPYQSSIINANISQYPPVQRSLTDKRPYISDAIAIEPGGQEVVLIVSPLRNNEGKIVALVGGQINPNGRKLTEITRLVKLGTSSYVNIIDSNGVILASSDTGRLLNNGTDGNKDEKNEIINSAHISLAPWSVTVRQSSKEALAPVRSITQQFIIFGLVSTLLVLFLGVGMARSLVRPISLLSVSVQQVSRGDLSHPTPQLGKDEIGELGQIFDSMRLALKKSLEEIQQWNRELEAKVEERTRELEESYREIEREEADRGRLLQKVLTAQEEERKRIARELHDETSQSLVSAVIRLETLTASATSRDTKNMLTEAKNLALRTIDNIHKIIFDLRPSILDDLGLLSAIRWYAENRLGAESIAARIEVTGVERKLPPQVEIALFRVTQEAINNIIKHAEAKNVVLSVEFAPSAIKIEIEDDGKGFDLNTVSLQPDEIRGVGLLGMKERMALIGGKLRITTRPGGGTYVAIEVSLDKEV